LFWLDIEYETICPHKIFRHSNPRMNFFGWYSILNLPPLLLFLTSLGYFVEILGVGFVFGYLFHPKSIKKRVWFMISIIVFGFFLGIVLQNITS
jgi:hypothetical protein